MIYENRFPQARRHARDDGAHGRVSGGDHDEPVVGSRLGAAMGWRRTLLLLGGVGLVLASARRATLVEPERGAAERRAGDATLSGVRETMRYLLGLSSIRHVAAGAALSLREHLHRGMGPTFLQRVHGLDVAGAGAWLGPASGRRWTQGGARGRARHPTPRGANVRWLLWAPAVEVCAVLRGCSSRCGPARRVPAYVGVTLLQRHHGARCDGGAGAREAAHARLAAALVSMATISPAWARAFVGGALSDRCSRGSATIASLALLVTACLSLGAATHFVLGARRLREEMERV